MRFLRVAKKRAQGSLERHKLGACLVKSGRVISTGCNATRHTNALAKRYWPWATVHAEIDVMHRANPLDVRGSTVYVFRWRRDKRSGLAKPCLRCNEAMREMGVKRVVYSTTDAPFFAVLDL